MCVLGRPGPWCNPHHHTHTRQPVPFRCASARARDLIRSPFLIASRSRRAWGTPHLSLYLVQCSLLPMPRGSHLVHLAGPHAQHAAGGGQGRAPLHPPSPPTTTHTRAQSVPLRQRPCSRLDSFPNFACLPFVESLGHPSIALSLSYLYAYRISCIIYRTTNASSTHAAWLAPRLPRWAACSARGRRRPGRAPPPRAQTPATEEGEEGCVCVCVCVRGRGGAGGLPLPAHKHLHHE